jgi:hypothetical protein
MEDNRVRMEAEVQAYVAEAVRARRHVHARSCPRSQSHARPAHTRADTPRTCQHAARVCAHFGGSAPPRGPRPSLAKMIRTAGPVSATLHGDSTANPEPDECLSAYCPSTSLSTSPPPSRRRRPAARRRDAMRTGVRAGGRGAAQGGGPAGGGGGPAGEARSAGEGAAGGAGAARCDLWTGDQSHAMSAMVHHEMKECIRGNLAVR